MWCCVWRTSRCLRHAHVEFRSRGERTRCLWPAHVELRSRGARKIVELWFGAAFGAHQDVSGLRMSSFVREASARSLSFRCQGVVLRVAPIKMSPACACRASCAKQAQDHYFEGSLHRGEAPSSHAQTPGLGTLCCVRVFQCLEFCGSRMVPLYRWKHLGFLRVCVVVFLQYILVGSWIGCLSVVVIVYLCLGLGVTCLLFVISPRGYCLCVVCV